MYHNVQMFHRGFLLAFVNHDVLAGSELLCYVSSCCPKAQKFAGTEALALEPPRL